MIERQIFNNPYHAEDLLLSPEARNKTIKELDQVIQFGSIIINEVVNMLENQRVTNCDLVKIVKRMKDSTNKLANNYHRAQDRFETCFDQKQTDQLNETNEMAVLELYRYVNKISETTGRDINTDWENYVLDLKIKNKFTPKLINRYLQKSDKRVYLKDKSFSTMLNEMKKVYFQEQVDIFEGKR
ncbi:MAG TPA: hypothetical protein P5562_02460 [Candidatus Woesebacteria bacterium]|nr:hypothetical protein [Candidatus Woesebacteria bacterium]